MTQPIEDDIYPNEGEAFSAISEPVEQKVARSKEKGEVLQALPMLRDVISRFDEQIALLNTLDSIPTSTRADEKMLLVNFHANDISKRFLMGQKEWLEGLIEDYAKS
jgi:predicted YcjX-like family ATPase